MAAGRSVEDILAGAKATLNKANALSDAAAKAGESAAPKPTESAAPKPTVSAAPPKHEYSNAPYSVAKEAYDTGKGIKSAMEMRAKAQKALQ